MAFGILRQHHRWNPCQKVPPPHMAHDGGLTVSLNPTPVAQTESLHQVSPESRRPHRHSLIAPSPPPLFLAALGRGSIKYSRTSEPRSRGHHLAFRIHHTLKESANPNTRSGRAPVFTSGLRTQGEHFQLQYFEIVKNECFEQYHLDLVQIFCSYNHGTQEIQNTK